MIKKDEKENKIIGVIKNIIQIIILIMFIILFNYGYIIKERLVKVLVIILIIAIYLFISNLIIELIKYWFEIRFNKRELPKVNNMDDIFSKEYQEKSDEIAKLKLKYKDRIERIIWILIIIQNIINPVAIMYLYFYEKLYFFLRWINLKLEKYEKIRWIIYKSILNILIKPIFRMYFVYYKVLRRWRSRTFVEIIFYRVEGLITSVILFSDAYEYFNGISMYKIILCVYIFFFLIEFWPKKLKIKPLSYMYKWGFSFLYEDRNESTLIGNIINLLCKEYNGIIKIDYYLVLGFYKNHYSKKLYWYDMIISSIDGRGWIMKEIKNKPSRFLFSDLFYLGNVGGKIMECFLGEQYFKGEDYIKANEIYKRELENIKKIIFCMWEIEEWIGIKRTKIYIDYYYMMLTTTSDENDEEIEENKLSKNNFNIEGKEANFRDVKEFYDEIYEYIVPCSNEKKKEDYAWLFETLDEKYNIWTVGVIYRDGEEKKLFKKEITTFLDKLEEEWLEKKNKKSYGNF